MTTLCIIDMQIGFSTAEHCLNQVCRQIRLAKRRNAGIVVLEYSGSGPTLSPIKELLASYKKKTYTKKSNDSGAREFLSATKRHGFTTNRVRFVGVNRDSCVHSTICLFHARRKNAKIEIAINATWCTRPRRGRTLLSNLGDFV